MTTRQLIYDMSMDASMTMHQWTPQSMDASMATHQWKRQRRCVNGYVNGDASMNDDTSMDVLMTTRQWRLVNDDTSMDVLMATHQWRLVNGYVNDDASMGASMATRQWIRQWRRVQDCWWGRVLCENAVIMECSCLCAFQVFTCWFMNEY